MAETCEQDELARAAAPDRETPRLSIAVAPSLETLAEAWNELSGDRPFCSYEWLGAWWRHFGSNQQLFTLAVRNERNELVAIAPWRMEHSCAQGNVIRFLGSGSVASDYLTLLCHDDYASVAPAAVGRWLATAARDHWDLLELTGVAVDDPAVERLVDALGALGHRIHRRRVQSCWRVGLPDQWSSYLETLSASRRQRTRGLLRKAFGAGRAQVCRVTNAAELEQGFGVLVDLHTRRRRSLGEPGCFADPVFTAFLRDAAGRMLATGRLRMFWLELEGQPIAAELGLTGRGVVHYYQGGIDPDFAADRPGWLCFAESLRTAIDEGYQAYDFLRGDEPYKASWGARPQAMDEIRLAARRPSSQLRLSLWRAQAELKRGVWKSLRTSPESDAARRGRARRLWRAFWKVEAASPPAAGARAE